MARAKNPLEPELPRKGKIHLHFSPEAQQFPSDTETQYTLIPHKVEGARERTEEEVLDGLSQLIIDFYLEWRRLGKLTYEPVNPEEPESGS
jgi:hypothetical protein